jgi:hypothetical protein
MLLGVWNSGFWPANSMLESLRLAAPKLGADDFAAKLSEIIRTFLHRQTGVLARYATSPEILGDRPRADQPPPPPVIAAFRDALKYGPTVADRTVQTDALIDSALAAVKAASLVEVAPAFMPAPSLPPAPLPAPTSGTTMPTQAPPPPLPSAPPPLPGVAAERDSER